MNKQYVSLLFRSSVFLVISAVTPSIAHALDTPRDTRGTVVSQNDIHWEWAGSSGAVRYQLDVNGSFVEYVEGTNYYSRDLADGDYTFTVQAVDSNNVHSHRSQPSAAVTIGASASNDGNRGNAGTVPGNVQGTQTGSNSARWTWTGVQGAESYIVYLDGNGQDPRQTNDEYLVIDNLSDGGHSVKVAAIDSATGKHSDQSVGAAVTINSNFSNAGAGNNDSGNNNVAPPPPADDNGLIDPASWNYNLKPGYTLLFSDEFNANAINPNRWNTQLRWDGSWNGERYEYRLINGESQFYVNTLSQDQAHIDKFASVHNPFEFDGSRLAIRSIKNPLKNHDSNTNYDPSNSNSSNDNYQAHGPLDLIAHQQPFLSGVISSYDKFSLKYGYIEARIKIPAHLGTFPAFWLHHQEPRGNTRKTEIDIMENLGHKPEYVYTAAHYYNNVNNGIGGNPKPVDPQPYGQIYTGIDYSQDYHVYAVEWKQDHIRYLIDDVEVSRVSDGAFNHENLYVILNLAVGGLWTNMPTTSGGTGRVNEGNQFPSRADVDSWGNPALEIDYVRIYKPQ